MHLELLKNGFILPENINLIIHILTLKRKKMIHRIDKNFANFYLFCLHGDCALRAYLHKNPNNILSLIRQYIHKIAVFFKYTRKKDIVFILEQKDGRDLVISNLHKFFREEYMRNDSHTQNQGLSKQTNSVAFPRIFSCIYCK